MSAAAWVLVDENHPLPPKCGEPSSKAKSAMHCEFEPNHPERYHFGRDRMGRWRSWTTEGGQS